MTLSPQQKSALDSVKAKIESDELVIVGYSLHNKYCCLKKGDYEDVKQIFEDSEGKRFVEYKGQPLYLDTLTEQLR